MWTVFKTLLEQKKLINFSAAKLSGSQGMRGNVSMEKSFVFDELNICEHAMKKHPKEKYVNKGVIMIGGWRFDIFSVEKSPCLN